MLKLSIQDNEGKNTVIPLGDGDLSIGRDENNAICLTERNVSRQHARVVTQAGRVYVENISATYGTRFNNLFLRERTEVGPGDVVQVGDYVMEVIGGSAEVVRDTALVDDDAQPAPAGGPPPDNATAIVNLADIQTGLRPDGGAAAVLPARERPRLVVQSQNLRGTELEISRSPTVVGRMADSADLVIDHRSISKEHARLTRHGDGTWEVLDLASANGIRVNGEPYSKVALSSGDLIELGHVTVAFVGPGDQAPAAGAGRGGKSNIGLMAAIALLVLLTGAAVAFFALGGHDIPAQQGQTAAPGTVGPAEDDAPVEANEAAATRRDIGEVLDQVGKLRAGGMVREALTLAKQAQRQSPGNAQVQLLVTELEREIEATEKLKQIEAQIDEDPKSALDAATDLGDMIKEGSALRERWKSLRDKANALVIAQLLQDAEKLINQRRLEDATGLLEQVLEMDPDSREAARLLQRIKDLGERQAPAAAPSPRARPAARPQAAPRAAVKPTPKAEPKPAPKPEPKPAPKPEPKAEPAASADDMSGKDLYREARKSLMAGDKPKALTYLKQAAGKGYRKANGLLAKQYLESGDMGGFCKAVKPYLAAFPSAADAAFLDEKRKASCN